MMIKVIEYFLIDNQRGEDTRVSYLNKEDISTIDETENMWGEKILIVTMKTGKVKRVKELNEGDLI